MKNSAGFLSQFGGISRALAIRNYRIYWLGQLLMVQGFWIQKITAGFLIFDMTGSPAWLGAVGFGYHIPLLIFGPFAGAIADRLGLRFVTIATSTFGAVNCLVIATLIWTDLMTPLLLVILMTVQGFQFAIEFPARQSLIGRLVDRQNLSAAVALNATTYHSSAFIGPLIGGLLLNFLGAGAGFAANAICMIWMTGALILIRPPADAARRLAERRKSAFLDDFKAGIIYTVRHPHLRLLFMVTFFVSLLIRPYIDFLPGFAADIFGKGEQGLANMMAVSGIGAFCFAIVLALRGATKGLTRVIAIGNVVTCLALIVFALTDTYAIGLIGLLVVGGFLVSASIGAQSLVQHWVDEAYRGRVVSIYVSMGVGLPALGALAVGWIAESFGLQIALAGITFLGLITLLPIVVLIFKHGKQIEAEPETRT